MHTRQGHASPLKNNATITSNAPAVPAELDDIYAALDKLSVALGPKGANKGGQSARSASCSSVVAANLKGNGTALGNSITKLSQAAQTLADQQR